MRTSLRGSRVSSTRSTASTCPAGPSPSPTTLSDHFPTGQLAPDSHTRIVRWDQSGKIYEQDGTTLWWDLGAAGSDGTVPVPGADTTLILESGITVTFSLSSPTGAFNVGDFWTFAARTADGIRAGTREGAAAGHPAPLHEVVHRYLQVPGQLHRLPYPLSFRRR